MLTVSLLLLLFITFINAQVEITASDGNNDDVFGWSVSISNDYSIIGAPYKNSNKGAAYIYHRNPNNNNWLQHSVLTLSNGVSYDVFGWSVSLSNDYAIVGAYGKNTSQGAAYIYYRNSTNTKWSQQSKITASDGSINDFFGYSTSLSNDYAIVGAYGKNISQGAAYIYYRNSNDNNNWLEQSKITASDGDINDFFGWSVSISNDYAIVSAPYKDSNKGAAYIYYHNSNNNNWLQQSILTASDGVINDYFGVSVSLSNNYAIVCANGKDSLKGSAYIYHRNSNNNNWLEQTILTASDGVAGDNFGVSVSISNNNVIVGASNKNSHKGAAYIFHHHSNNNWLEQSILTASDGVSNDHFGVTVAILNDYAIVGAIGKNSNKGAAYVYHNCNPGSSMDGMNCSICTPGKYQPYEFSLSCLMCPAGSYCPESNSTSPTTCSIGTYSNETGLSIDCPLCPTGSYCESPTTKTTCPAGSYCASGSINPNTPCPAGYYCLFGTTIPTPCQDGYYCVIGSSGETPCTTSCPSNAPIIVSKCTHEKDLVCSSIFDDRSFSVPWTLLGLFIGLLVLVLVLSEIMRRKYPESKPIRLFMFIFAVIDCASDIVFILHVRDILHLAFIGSIGVFILSILTQGGYLTYLISSEWMNNVEFQEFVSHRTFWFGLVFLVSSTNIESILFLSSKVFRLDMLSAPLNHDDELLVERAGIIGVVFETIPQLVIQLLVALHEKDLSGIVGFALLISIIQLCIAISKYVWICVLHIKKNNKNNIEGINNSSVENKQTPYFELINDEEDIKEKEVNM